VTCPRCGETNPSQARFCIKGGASVTFACAKCGTELPASAAFCFVWVRGPEYFARSVRVGAFSFPILRLFMIGAAAVLFAVLWWFQERTRTGAMVRAAVDNAEMAEALGINVPLLRMGVFGLGALMAGLGL
jgi:branched-subunit amino acid ABC-type transport system permease component